MLNLFWIFLYLILFSFNLQALERPGAFPIYTNGESAQFHDLRGEEGESGKDAIVHYDNLKDLAKIKLDQSGSSSQKFGELYLVQKNERIEDFKSTALLSLVDFETSSISLGVHLWKKNVGAKKLFASGSKIADEYWTHKESKKYNISLKWQSRQSINTFSDTKIAISLFASRLEVRSFTGAILDYKILRNGDNIVIEIINAYSEYQIHSLELGRLRGEGAGLYLEVKDRHSIGPQFKTKFAVTLYRKNIPALGKEDLGSFDITEDFITYNEETNCFQISLGKLNFPEKYKQPGTFLKVYLSTFRNYRGQLRSKVLSGTFKI